MCTSDYTNQAAVLSPRFQYDITVSCCELDGSGGARPNCTAHPKTYEEAVGICDHYGYRLCTLQEMFYDELTRNQGCDYDGSYTWVSDSCDPTMAPTTIPTNNPTAYPVQILNITYGRQCHPNRNLGTGFANKSQCATYAMEDPLCTTNVIMWSDSYNYAWGCTCCQEGAVYEDNPNWDLCRYGYGTCSIV